jgi:CHAD domain-containing protein
VAPLVGKPARRLAKAARGVQRTLGDRQDAVVAAEWLRGAASRVPRQAAFVAGVLAERERHELARPASRWKRAWKKLRGASKRFGKSVPG